MAIVIAVRAILTPAYDRQMRDYFGGRSGGTADSADATEEKDVVAEHHEDPAAARKIRGRCSKARPIRYQRHRVRKRRKASRRLQVE